MKETPEPPDRSFKESLADALADFEMAIPQLWLQCTNDLCSRFGQLIDASFGGVGGTCPECGCGLEQIG